MKREDLSISEGGVERLRQAIEAEIRRDYDAELKAATGYWQKVKVRREIRRKVAEEMKRLASPHSLWQSQ